MISFRVDIGKGTGNADNNRFYSECFGKLTSGFHAEPIKYICDSDVGQ
jgi:hypothetical protein